MIYLAYGSNLNMEQMAYRCPSASVLGTSVLQDYRLLFRGWKNTAVATVEPQKGSNVPVLLWDIKLSDEKALDRYEGFPWHYRKETVKVDLNGSSVDAMVYIRNPFEDYGMPNYSYYSVILKGYLSQRFDVDVLKKAVQDSLNLSQL